MNPRGRDERNRREYFVLSARQLRERVEQSRFVPRFAEYESVHGDRRIRAEHRQRLESRLLSCLPHPLGLGARQTLNVFGGGFPRALGFVEIGGLHDIAHPDLSQQLATAR
jgi:hypothetical protein